MTYLHALNPPVCHGDLKPENVLVSGDGEALISDLGLSEAYRSTSAGWSTSGVTQGTRHYRSYELLFENQQTLAGDVYAFGCLVLTVSVLSVCLFLFSDQPSRFSVAKFLSLGNLRHSSLRRQRMKQCLRHRTIQNYRRQARFGPFCSGAGPAVKTHVRKWLKCTERLVNFGG